MELTLEKTTIWDDILGLVRGRLNRQVFDTWFLPIRFVELDEQQKELRVAAGDVTKDWVCRYYADLLDATLKELNLSGFTIAWTAPAEASPDRKSVV